MVPLAGVHLLDLGLGIDAGVGAEHVDPAVLLGRGRGHGLHRVEVGDVAGEGGRRAAVFAELRGRCLGVGLGPRHHQDLGAVAGEDPGDALADPLARPRYDDRPAFN